MLDWVTIDNNRIILSKEKWKSNKIILEWFFFSGKKN